MVRRGKNMTTKITNDVIQTGTITFDRLASGALNGQTIANLTVSGTLTASGNLSISNIPAFNAYIGYGAMTRVVSGNGVLTSNWATNLNNGSRFNTSTGRFTASVAGYYHFTLMVSHSGGSDVCDFGIAKNDAIYGEVFVIKSGTVAAWKNGAVSATMYLAANETAAAIATAYTGNAGSGRVNFSGHKIG